MIEAVDDMQTCWTLPVSRWSVWDAGRAAGKSASPELGFIDAMQRRRLSPLARAALHVANQCAGHLPSVRFVYASGHGELPRTMELLHNLAENSPLSPTAFGLSVLNACPGLYSIIRGDSAPATAIAGGSDSLAWGLLEAFLRANDGSATPVLFVYADAPLPPPLPANVEEPADVLALGLLIVPDAEHRLACRRTAGRTPVSTLSQAATLAQMLADGGTGEWNDSDHGWSWSLQ